MRIGYSATIWDGGTSGIGIYIAEQLARLARRDDVHVRAIEFGGRVLARGDSPARSGTGRGAKLRLTPLRDIAFHRRGLARVCADERFDLVHVPTIRRLPGRLPCPAVVTVHDLGPIRLAGKYGKLRDLYHRVVIPRWLRGVAAIVTPSEATKADLVACYGVDPARVTVVPNGIDHARFHPGDRTESAARVRAALGLDGPYLVYVSRLEHPAKNHVRLVEAFARARDAARLPHRLLLVGAPWNGHEAVERACAPLVAQGAVVLAGHVAAADLPHVYRAAEAAVYPSLFEGFGMPVLEAMACATPVACSRSSSLTEIADGHGLLFDQLDVDAIADALTRLATDGALRERLRASGLARAAGFTWDRSVDETVAVWRRAAGRP